MGADGCPVSTEYENVSKFEFFGVEIDDLNFMRGTGNSDRKRESIPDLSCMIDAALIHGERWKATLCRRQKNGDESPRRRCQAKQPCGVTDSGDVGGGLSTCLCRR